MMMTLAVEENFYCCEAFRCMRFTFGLGLGRKTMLDYNELIAKSTRRVVAARKIADDLRGDDRLHRLAMQTVFVLEDALVMLNELAKEQESASSSNKNFQA